MTYVDLLNEEHIPSNYLAILKPRRYESGFTVFSGSVYSVAFDYGDVSSVTVDGTNLTMAFNTSLAAGEFYYDTETEILYVRTPSSGNPNSVNTVVTYRLYVATFDAHHYSSPLDNTSRVVYYEPIIIKSPDIKSTNSESFFGFLPSQSSSIALNNAEHVFERHLFDSSFNRAEIEVYHWLDELEIANLKLVYKGTMSDVSYDDSKINIKTFDSNEFLQDDFRNPTGDNFFSVATFPDLNQQFIGQPIRQIYGRVDGFVPVNIDFWQDNPTTSDNRVWVVCNGQTGLSEISKTVGTGNTTTRTYVNNADGLNVGDTVFLDGATDYYVEITTVNRTGSQYIEHAAIGAPMTSGEFVKRGFVSAVYIKRQGVTYTAFYKRDYDCSLALSGGSSGFTFNASVEANLGITVLEASDAVNCRCYGRTNDVTLNAIAFGGNHTGTGNMSNPLVVMVDILKRNMGIAESQINISSFTALVSSITSAVGFAVPKTASGKFDSYKEVIANILRTELFRLYLDDNQKWTIAVVAPLGANDYSIESDEIINNTFSHDFSYNELLSDVLVEYNFQEIKPNTDQSGGSNVSAQSNVAKYVHKANKQKTFESLHVYDTDAQILCNKLAYYFGDRIGEIKLNTKNRFFNTRLGDVLQVSRAGQCGFSYDSEVLNNRSAAITSVAKSLKSVNIIMDDQKGIEDNSIDWGT